jgi:ubiquitin C-terminal hydrolase
MKCHWFQPQLSFQQKKAGRRQFSLYNRVYWIAYYPEILVLFNVSGNLQNNVTTPLEIHLPAPYCDYPYPDMKEETKSYDLFALVVKSGTFNGGHVWCYVKQPVSVPFFFRWVLVNFQSPLLHFTKTVDENSAWIKVDDHKTKLMASPFPDIQHDQSVRLWFYVLSDRK